MGLADVDLSFGSRFALYSGVMQAAVGGMGVAMGHSAMIEDELESGRPCRYRRVGVQFTTRLPLGDDGVRVQNKTGT